MERKIADINDVMMVRMNNMYKSHILITVKKNERGREIERERERDRYRLNGMEK